MRSVDMCRWLAFLAAAVSLPAQDKIVQTKVFSEPPGGEFTVDGQRYRGTASFFWPERSKHVLGIPETAPDNLSRYVFKEWRDATGERPIEGPTLAITADADIPYYKAVFKAFHSVSLQFEAGLAPFSCEQGPEWGKIYLNLPDERSCYTGSQSVWGEAGKTVRIEVHPPAGFVFLGWSGTLNGLDAPTISFVLDRPMILYPKFAPAAIVTLESSPPGLRLFADHQEVPSPISFDWAERSQHTVGALSPQRAPDGNLWVFDSWSDGGAEHHVYTTGGAYGSATLTANFVPGIPLGVVSSPPGLKLTVDGRPSSEANFVWGLGSRHTIAAPAELADSKGRRYAFRAWSHGGEAAQEVTVGPDTRGWLAYYEPLNGLRVNTNPSGIAVAVDGAECVTPCTVYRRAAAEVSIAAPGSAQVQDGTRIEFDAWADGQPAASRTLSLTAELLTLTANYRYFYRLATEADPAEGADFRFEPASPDGYFAAGSSVAVIAQPRPGFRFRKWEGDLTGGIRSGFIKLDGPRTVRAVLDREPYVAPAGVRNAAAETPEEGVAPGSIIAIYGGSLAPGQQAGPRSPLAQTLAGVTVRAGDRILPLFFVSPEQINALLPSDFPEGDHKLIVRWEGHPEVTTGFRVVHNAPGLFITRVESVDYALAAHADGSAVTDEAPARLGETVTLFGTGFGPYRGTAPDGFAVPEGLELPLADPIEIILGESRLAPESAGAAPGEIGVVAVRFRIPEADAGLVELRVSANNRMSNTVLLPLGPENLK
jgi:uncharacterized protein (TIGR03437 family)